MKFNFKVRAKNPVFWISNIIAVLVYIGGYLGVKGEDVTSWGKLFDILGDIVSNPYLIVMIIVTLVTTAISYTDKGIRDTGFVKQLEKPRDDKDPEQAAGFIKDTDNKKSEIDTEDGVKTPVEFSKEDDNEDIDPYHMEEDETFFKDESKPYGIDWDEEAIQENVDNKNVSDEEVSKGEDK